MKDGKVIQNKGYGYSDVAKDFILWIQRKEICNSSNGCLKSLSAPASLAF
ncbi:MAG TPA: hypothetical protein VFI29_01915 [Hanamia sp.]|nr:hypothetical protein [Hanamia sp.]